MVPLADATLLGVGLVMRQAGSGRRNDSTNDGSLDIVIGAPFSSLSEPQSGSVSLCDSQALVSKVSMQWEHN